MPAIVELEGNTAPLNSALSQTQRGVNRTLRQFGTMMQRGTASLNGFITSIRGLSFSFGGLAIAGGLAFTAIGVGVRTAINSFKKLSERFKELSNNAQKHDMGVESFQKLAFVANRTGNSVNTLVGIFEKLNNAISKARKGNLEYLDFFTQLKIAVNELEGLSPDQIFDKINKSLKANNIDIRSIRNVGNILSPGEIRALERMKPYDVGALSRQASAAGMVVPPNVIKSVNRFNQAMTDSSEAFMNTVIQMKLFKESLEFLGQVIDKISKKVPMGNTTYNQEFAAYKQGDASYKADVAALKSRTSSIKDDRRRAAAFNKGLKEIDAKHKKAFEEKLKAAYGEDAAQIMIEDHNAQFEVQSSDYRQAASGHNSSIATKLDTVKDKYGGLTSSGKRLFSKLTNESRSELLSVLNEADAKTTDEDAKKKIRQAISFIGSGTERLNDNVIHLIEDIANTIDKEATEVETKKKATSGNTIYNEARRLLVEEESEIQLRKRIIYYISCWKV